MGIKRSLQAIRTNRVRNMKRFHWETLGLTFDRGLPLEAFSCGIEREPEPKRAAGHRRTATPTFKQLPDSSAVLPFAFGNLRR